MDVEIEASPTALNVLEQSDAWAALHELDRIAWLRRATAATTALAKYFHPRSINLRYSGPYHGFLFLLGEDGSVSDAGKITLEEPL
jgi:hypothetical protein